MIEFAALIVWGMFGAGIVFGVREWRREAAVKAERRLREIRRMDMREWYRDEGEQ